MWTTIAFVSHVDGEVHERGETRKRPLAVPDVADRASAQRSTLLLHSCAAIHTHQPTGVRIWQRVEQRRLDDGKHSSVDADAERQCDRRNQGEGRRARELPKT